MNCVVYMDLRPFQCAQFLGGLKLASRVISNLLTGDETWMHMFEPQRRADNKQWK